MQTLIRRRVLCTQKWDSRLIRILTKWHEFSWSAVVSVFHRQTRMYKINKMACAPSKDSDQPGHSPSLIRVFAVRMKKAWVLSYPLSAQRRLWSDWADAQADLSLRWAHSHFDGFVMRRLNLQTYGILGGKGNFRICQRKQLEISSNLLS